MSRNPKTKSRKLPPFAALTLALINSTAYKELTPSAAKALPYFISQAKGSGKTVNTYSGVFELSYGTAEALGFASRTFARVIEKLVANGFIDMAGYGGLRGNCKSFNLFRLSGRWQAYGQPWFEEVNRYPSEPSGKR